MAMFKVHMKHSLTHVVDVHFISIKCVYLQLVLGAPYLCQMFGTCENCG